VKASDVTMQNSGVTREGWIAYAVAATVVALDQLTKAWVLYGLHLPIVRSIPVWPPIFRLDMVFNDGMSFGLLHASGPAGRWFLTVFALAVAGGLGWWARTSDRPLFAWAAGLLIGGSLGNVIDRFRLGAVVDFLDFSGLHFPYIFNIADSGVTAGAALLLIEAFWPSLRSLLDSRQDRGN
jgi:signal peptidase II